MLSYNVVVNSKSNRTISGLIKFKLQFQNEAQFSTGTVVRSSRNTLYFDCALRVFSGRKGSRAGYVICKIRGKLRGKLLGKRAALGKFTIKIQIFPFLSEIRMNELC